MVVAGWIFVDLLKLIRPTRPKSAFGTHVEECVLATAEVDFVVIEESAERLR